MPLDAVLFPKATTCHRRDVYAWLFNHPRPQMEQPQGHLYCQPSPYVEIEALQTQWQQHARAIVQRFLGTPWLPDMVAAWLLGRR